MPSRRPPPLPYGLPSVVQEFDEVDVGPNPDMEKWFKIILHESELAEFDPLRYGLGGLGQEAAMPWHQCARAIGPLASGKPLGQTDQGPEVSGGSLEGHLKIEPQ
jgi:hypothetical protein